ncbi:sulfurtransferase TusA family protein [bacterium]|nr:sulfurtransferase TusA family protein [bacterium]MBU1599883.1 sulfurtransferase TusA family protein [bacterium]
MDIKSIIPVKEIDVLGRVCPYPLVMLKKATQDINPGDVVKILCDSEPSVTKEMPTFCEKKGLLMDSVRLEEKGYWEVYIMKKEDVR